MFCASVYVQSIIIRQENNRIVRVCVRKIDEATMVFLPSTYRLIYLNAYALLLIPFSQVE